MDTAKKHAEPGWCLHVIRPKLSNKQGESVNQQICCLLFFYAVKS
jgi:hypothetical protein